MKGHHKQGMVVGTDGEIKGGWMSNRRVDMKHRQIEREWMSNKRVDMKHRQIKRGWTLNRTEDWKQIS